MQVTIGLHLSKLTWDSSKEESQLLSFMNIGHNERLNRFKEVHPSSAEALCSYIRSKGLKVNLIYEDAFAQAKATYWQHALINGPAERLTRPEYESFLKQTRMPLREIQKEALFKILNSCFSLNAAICGTGKTLTTLMQSLYFHMKGENVLTIIAAPVSCMSEYGKEITSFRGFFQDLSLEEVSGASVEEMKLIIRHSTANILVVSLNSLDRLAEELVNKMANHQGKLSFVVEEGHFVKELETRRSRGAQMLAPLCSSVLVNTATPIPRANTDIRGILSLVGIPQPVTAYSGNIPPKDFSFLSGVTFVSDEEDLPYAALRTEYLPYRNLSELSQKMIDVVNGQIKDKNKVVIFCSTNKGLQKVWSDLAGVNKTVLSGSFYVDNHTSQNLHVGRSFEHQQLAIDKFNNDPECLVLIANYRVGSTGINLQHSGAKVAFFYEISNNGADFFQARYRIRRPFVSLDDEFVYYFARSEDPKKKRSEDRQFAKLANQRSLLDDIKRLTRGNYVENKS